MLRIKPKDVRNLAFKGGSVKGIAYLGCIQALQEVDESILKNVKNVAGTSAGSITALCVSLNLYEKPDKLRKYCFQDITDFLDAENDSLKERFLSFSESNGFWKCWTASAASSSLSSMDSDKLGFAVGQNFRDWIESIIWEHTNIKNCTFEELEGDGVFKSLHIVAFDLTTRESLVFSKTSTPKAIISDAIRSSISIPYIFQPHQCYYKNDETGDRYVPAEMDGHHLIDGGIALNYPISVLNNCPGETIGFYLTSEKVKKCHQQKYPPNKFRGIESERHQKIYEIKSTKSKELSHRNFTRSVYQSYQKYKAQGKKHNETEREKDRTIYINHLDIDSLDFNIDNAMKGQLIAEGKKSTLEYFGIIP